MCGGTKPMEKKTKRMRIDMSQAIDSTREALYFISDVF